MKWLYPFINLSRFFKTESVSLNNLETQVRKKYSVFLSSIIGFTIFIVFVFIAEDFFDGKYILVIANCFTLVLLLTSLYLNIQNKFKSSGILFILATNFMVFLFANVYPNYVLNHVLFLPILVVTLILNKGQRSLINGFLVFLPIILYLLLEISDYKIHPGLPTFQQSLPFNLNYLVTFFALIYIINFLLKINYHIESNQHNLTKQLATKNENLEKANKELDRFAYSTSHDLKAPLKSILGLVQLVQIENVCPQVSQYLDMMKNRVFVMENFINEITDHSRNARMPVKKEKVDFNQLIHKVIDGLQFIDGASKIKFIRKVELSKPINSDPHRLFILLNNFVSNSIKYHNLNRPDPFIKISVENPNGHVLLKVADNGLGIRKESQSKIFDMFYRASEDSSGSGLGLYIVKEIVDTMKGKIALQSSSQKGTEFLVSIPNT